MTVNNTEDAVNVFDAICYRKGASFIRQLSHYLGREVLTRGMKDYFNRFAFKNTQLSDFIHCLQKAQDEVGESEVNIQAWTDNWLTKAGANEISIDFSSLDDSGKGEFTVI